MALKAKRPCIVQGCTHYAAPGSGKCRNHLNAERRAWRSDRGGLYNTSLWKAAREAYLRGHPLCEECSRQGRIAVATVVDHIVPHKGDREKFFDANNWQALCKTCHDTKTATEDGGFGREITRPYDPARRELR